MGCSVSSVYMILASVYHFFMPGFGIALFGLITSFLYLGFTCRDIKKYKILTTKKQPLSEVADEEEKTDNIHRNSALRISS
jgi:hypothetical protein